MRLDYGRCIVCCGKCDKNSSNFDAKCNGRLGRKTVHYCIACKVYLYNLCWVPVHDDKVQELLLCSERKLSLAAKRLLHFDVDQPKPWTPVRALIQTRRNADSSRTGIAAQLIGERIQQRVAGVLDSLPVITPWGALSESPLKRLRQIQGEVVSRRSVLAV